MFGRKSNQPTLSVETSPEVREALTQLRELVERRPELGELVRLYDDLLPELFGSWGATPKRPAGEPSIEGFAEGEPLFRVTPPVLDDRRLLAKWLIVCSRLQRHRDPGPLLQLSEAAARREIDPAAALRSVIENGPRDFQNLLGERGLDAALGMSVLRLCALPHLAKIVNSLDCDWQRLGWSKGYCPACGSWPLLAEFRGLEQFRWLRCSLCASGWQVDRVYCPFCETRDHRQLQDLVIEGQEQKYRVSVCDACRGHVLGISRLIPITGPGLLVAEVETLNLALIAEERGYRVPC